MNNFLLPITAFREQIVEAVKSNPVLVITAETGAGKSTQVPQYLLDEGYDLVVTQPRRLAARTVAQRVAEEIGEELGGTVGYRTAVDRRDSPSTRCLFCTDGLALVRELMGTNKGILVLDEVHEWNENMEVLVAWAKRQIEAGTDFKVVLMSATLEAEKLAAFYNGVPVISVPGRLFPVELRKPSSRLVDDVAALVRENRNVLVFQPGKQEIIDTVSALEQMQVVAEILPLHGELTPEEQAKCFKHYGRPKVVVSTNVAQTSVTIDDIDAVVDSGMERRIELVDGVEGLYLKPISLADATQRKGRAGRTKVGIYIDHCSSSSRPDFPVAEIMRKRLDQTVLRLAIAGFDMEELEFFHQPAKSEIHDAKRVLVSLGCLTADGQITKIGRLVNRLPVSVQYGRMLVEADRLGVVDDVLTVAAILEQGGITVPPPSRNQPDRPDWRRMVPDETESDVMGQLAVWEMAEDMTKDEMHEKGVSLRKFFRAKEIRQHLAQAVKQFFKFGSTGRREDILKAVCAGMVDHLYKGLYGSYRNGEGIDRELGTASLVRGADWLVGKPFDLQIKTRRGSMTLKLIELASKVDPMWLVEIAPQLTERKNGLNPRYNSAKDVVVYTTQTFFNGAMVREDEVVDGEHPEAAEVFARWLSGQKTAEDAKLDAVLRSNVARQEQARQLNIRSGEETFKVYSSEEMFERYTTALAGARRISEIMRPEALTLPALDERMIKKALREQPDKITVLGRDVMVEYRGGYTPRVRLDFRGDESQNWLLLPDSGIWLPGGREVSVYSAVEGYGYYIEAPSLQFKEKVRECLNQGLWDNWQKPELPAPTDSVSFIIETEYGRCVVSDASLVAYGTVNYDSWSGLWKTYWSRSQIETEKVYAQACTKFLEMKEKAVRDALKKRVGELYRAHSFNCELPEETRRRMYNTYYGYSGGATTVVEIEALIAEVEAAVVRINEQKAEAERKKREAEVRREEVDEALRNIGWAEAHIWVPADGDVAYVLGGKTSKMGSFEVVPNTGDTTFDGPYCFGDSKYRRWVPFRFGVHSQARDYSSGGNLQTEVMLFVPKNLLVAGVYGVGLDDEGQFFFSVIYHNVEGIEVVPEVSAISKIRAPKEQLNGTKSVDLSKVDLSGLFGGATKIRRR